MIQWEYKKVEAPIFKKFNEIDVLKEHGINGWELCAVIPGVSYYFKRQIPQDKYNLEE